MPEVDYLVEKTKLLRSSERLQKAIRRAQKSNDITLLSTLNEEAKKISEALMKLEYNKKQVDLIIKGKGRS